MSKRGYRVSFVEVGREKKSWERVFPAPLNANAVAQEAATALMSRGVEVRLDLEKGTGFVMAGFHKVGELRLLPCLVGAL